VEESDSEARFSFKRTQRIHALRKEKYASKIKSGNKRNKRKKITQAKNKSTQAQVTQLTQAVLAQKTQR